MPYRFRQFAGGIDDTPEERRVRLGDAPATRGRDHVGRELQPGQRGFRLDRLVTGDQYLETSGFQCGQARDGVRV
jgi:hypothetical protein